MRFIGLFVLAFGFGLMMQDVIKTHATGREVILPPKLLNDIRTVLDCPKGMSALVKGKHIVMANCVK